MRLWILGTPDPEMEEIERLLRGAGESVTYALGPDGERVRPHEAYRAQWPPELRALSGRVEEIFLVECCPLGWERAVMLGPSCVVDDPALLRADAAVRVPIVRIDHHRPGDHGYGRPPQEFLAASSLGQVVGYLAGHRFEWGALDWVILPRRGRAPDLYDGHTGPFVRASVGKGRFAWVVTAQRGDLIVPESVVLAAAADHCLAAAYRGECPGVDPEALMRWRAETRARYQGRSADAVLADVERARAALLAAPVIDLDHGLACSRHWPATPGRNAAWHESECDPDSPCVQPQTARDMRGRHVPELPEASARLGVCFVADGLPGPDGRIKIVCQSGSLRQIRAFIEVWAPEHGLVDIYGDPARGFAGGYLANESA